MDERIAAAIERRAKNGELRCAEAFRVAEELGVAPLAVGQTANELDMRLARCQLGLFGHGPQKSITEAAEEIPSGLEQAIRGGLILGRLPCAVAWAIAARFGMSKLHVANAAEGLEVRIGQCQLGAF
jgi:hypothetical protein